MQADDGAPGQSAPFAAAAVGLKPRCTAVLVVVRLAAAARLVVAGGECGVVVVDRLPDELCGDFGGWLAGAMGELVELGSQGGRSVILMRLLVGAGRCSGVSVWVGLFGVMWSLTR